MASGNLSAQTAITTPASGSLIYIAEVDEATFVDRKITFENFWANPDALGATTPGTGVFTTLAATTFTGTTVNATTFDTNVAAAGVTLAGTTLAADGTDSDINITITPKGTGSIIMSKVDINGGEITGITDLAVADGGTGASDASTARTNLGLAIGANVQAYDAFLASISSLGSAADKMIYTTAENTAAETAITEFGRSIIDDADEATFKATVNLEIGTDVQAYNAALTTMAGFSPTDGKIMVWRSAGSDWVLEDKPAGGSNPALNDVTDVSITSVTDKELLAYDNASGDWINMTAAEAGLTGGSGDVIGPASNTDSYVPQWNGADSKTLKNGLAVVTSVGSTGSDSSLPTEQAVREAVSLAVAQFDTPTVIFNDTLAVDEICSTEYLFDFDTCGKLSVKITDTTALSLDASMVFTLIQDNTLTDVATLSSAGNFSVTGTLVSASSITGTSIIGTSFQIVGETAFTDVATGTSDNDKIATKGYVDDNAGGSGDVVAPANNTNNYIPQWDGADSKTLKNGLAVVATIGNPGADTNIPTEQAVREAIAADTPSPLNITNSNLVTDSASTIDYYFDSEKCSSFKTVITDDTTDAEDAKFTFHLISGGTLTEVAVLENNGDFTVDGNLEGASLQITGAIAFTSVSTGTSDNNALVTKGYVDDNISGPWDGDIADIDIDGGADIGADLADADLIIVDDGAGGTNRKSAVSRIWTYVTGKIQGLSAKTTPTGSDILTIQDAADSNILKELTINNLMKNQNIDFISGHIETAANKTYYIDQSARYAYTIKNIYIQDTSGTCTAKIQIDGSDVTGISSVSVSSSENNATATGSNTVDVGDTVTLVISSNSSALDVRFTIEIERTSS